MNYEFRFPEWQEPLAEAATESDPERSFEKLQHVERIINRRIQELFSIPTKYELLALCDALDIIRCLRKERRGD